MLTIHSISSKKLILLVEVNNKLFWVENFSIEPFRVLNLIDHWSLFGVFMHKFFDQIFEFLTQVNIFVL